MPGEGASASGGVAVLTRKGMGIRELPLPDALFGHRLSISMVNGVCRGGLAVGSVYLKDSHGMSDFNRAVLDELTQRLGRLRVPWVVGGD